MPPAHVGVGWCSSYINPSPPNRGGDSLDYGIPFSSTVNNTNTGYHFFVSCSFSEESMWREPTLKSLCGYTDMLYPAGRLLVGIMRLLRTTAKKQVYSAINRRRHGVVGNYAPNLRNHFRKGCHRCGHSWSGKSRVVPLFMVIFL